MRVKISIHEDNTVSIASPGIVVLKNDNPESIEIEADKSIFERKITAVRRGEEIELDIPGRGKRRIKTKPRKKDKDK